MKSNRTGNSEVVVARLRRRGVEYTDVKRIVQFERPHNALFVEQWFNGRRTEQVLNQLTEWKALLKKDFVLKELHPELKKNLAQVISAAELIVCRAWIENTRTGEWGLKVEIMPTGRDETGRPVYVNPDFEISATHRRTREIRRARVEGEIDPIAQSASWSRALGLLGVRTTEANRRAGRIWTSRRRGHGWPLFTRQIIPRLYEYLAPNYKIKGHHSERRDGAKLSRLALHPTELLQDMLDILRLEYPREFADATLPQLKAVIQRFLAKATPERQELSPRSLRELRK